jgi:chemotaxis protein histidine kinase CheA
LIKRARAIKGGAKIVELQTLVELGKALEDFFEKKQTAKATPSDEEVKILKEIQSATEILGRKAPDELIPSADELQRKVKHWVEQLQTGKPSKPIEEAPKQPETPKVTSLAFDENMLDLFASN